MKYLVLIIIYTSPFYCSLFGQNTLKGRVVNTLSEPVEYATVYLQDSLSKTILDGTTTDSLGEFELSMVDSPSENIMFYVKHISFVDYAKALYEIVGNELLITLTEGYFLNEVEVRAIAPKLIRKANKYVIDFRGSNSYKGKNLEQVIDKFPGIRFTASGDLEMIGGRSINILVNGRRENLSGQELKSFLASLTIEELKTIEIVTNPSSEYEASGTGGVLSIETKKQTKDGYKGFVYAFGSQGKRANLTTAAKLDFKKGKVNISNRIVLDRNDILYAIESERKVDNGTITERQRDLNRIKLLPGYDATIQYNVNKKTTLGFDFQFRSKTFDQNFESEIPSNGFDFPNTRNTLFESNQSFNYGLFQRTILDSLNSEISFDLNFLRINNTGEGQILFSGLSPIETLNRDEAKSISSQVDFKKNLANQSFALGARYARSEKNIFNNYTGSSTIDLPARFEKTADQINREEILAGYLKYSNSLSEKIEIEIGLRGEYSSSKIDSQTVNTFNYTVFNLFPSAALTLSKGDAKYYGLSFGSRINRPRFSDINAFLFIESPISFSTGNVRLIPERYFITELSYSDIANNFFVSITSTIGRSILGEVYNLEDNFIIYEPVNLGESNAFGGSITKYFYLKDWLELFGTFDGMYTIYDYTEQTRDRGWEIGLTTGATVTFPKAYIFDVSLAYTPKNILEQNLRLNRSIWNIDLSLNKTLGSFDITLGASDLINSFDPSYSMIFPNDDYRYVQNLDFQRVYLSVIYTFKNENEVKLYKRDKSNKQEQLRLNKDN